MDGFVCPWRRLLRYHANLEPLVTAPPLLVGQVQHRSLELLLQPYLNDATPQARPLDLAESAAQAALLEIHPSTWESDPSAPLHKDMVVALTHGYARHTLPWLLDNFILLAIEQEMTYAIDHPSMPMVWMSRPDLVARNRQSGRLSAHDFKTTSYWQDTHLQEWAESVQMMMQAHVASLYYHEPVPTYYVHMLVKGTDKYPSPLVEAYYREPMPPFQTEDWQVKKPYGRDMKYRKVRVSDHRSLSSWIWQMPPQNESFIIGGPFNVHDYKVKQFLAGLPANEWWWQQSLAQHGSQIQVDRDRDALDRTFPRTYNCYTYGARCPYYRVCFDPDWQSHYKPRVPHHSTEEL